MDPKLGDIDGGDILQIAARMLWGISFASLNLGSLAYAVADRANAGKRVGASRAAIGVVQAMSLVGGACFYSASFLVPQYLGTIAGYNALESGKVMIFAALSSIVLMAAIPLLARTIPCPIIIVTGMLLLSAACWHNAM